MKKIIVPVDFSKTSKDAYLYARALAPVFNASLRVIHVYSGSFNTNEPVVFKPGKGRHETIVEELQHFVNDVPITPEGPVLTSIKVETAALHGFTVAEIVKEAGRCQAFMIVMGTTGEHDVLEKALGSVSTGVAQRASCPVLLIPQGVSYQPYTNILYASNYESATEKMLKKNIDFANTFRAALHFIHVQQEEHNGYQAVEDSIFELLFRDGEPAFAFNLAAVPATSVHRGLSRYSAENQIDLIVVVNQQRSFFDNVLGRSTTKEMALYTRVPLLVYST